MRYVAALFLCLLVPATVAAKPSQSPIDAFSGDRYVGRTGLAEATERHLYRAKRARSGARAGLSRRWTAPATGVARRISAARARAAGFTSVWGGLGREMARASGRPRAWCGWWLGHHLGMPRRDLWLARNWASVGSNAGGPQIGAVVVWRHHVGVITGRQGNQWIIKSGNDGRRVRERPRSIAGAIAFRRV